MLGQYNVTLNIFLFCIISTNSVVGHKLLRWEQLVPLENCWNQVVFIVNCINRAICNSLEYSRYQDIGVYVETELW